MGITSLPQVSLTSGMWTLKIPTQKQPIKLQARLGFVTQTRAQGEDVTEGKPPEMRKSFADSGV